MSRAHVLPSNHRCLNLVYLLVLNADTLLDVVCCLLLDLTTSSCSTVWFQSRYPGRFPICGCKCASPLISVWVPFTEFSCCRRMSSAFAPHFVTEQRKLSAPSSFTVTNRLDSRMQQALKRLSVPITPPSCCLLSTPLISPAPPRVSQLAIQNEPLTRAMLVNCARLTQPWRYT